MSFLLLVIGWWSYNYCNFSNYGDQNNNDCINRLLESHNVDNSLGLQTRYGHDSEDSNTHSISIPAVFLNKLPDNIHHYQNSEYRKNIFIKCLLPLILKVNNGLLKDRERLIHIKRRLDTGQFITRIDQHWLNLLQQKYKLKALDMNKLLWHVDVIPPSLALAQAIEETGWGTSSAARLKHSTFGITLSSGVKRYDSLMENVEAYVNNLNLNPAYSKMRDIRQHMRYQGENLCSLKLTAGLLKYSELRKRYLNKLHVHIRHNDLKEYDFKRLAI